MRALIFCFQSLLRCHQEFKTHGSIRGAWDTWIHFFQENVSIMYKVKLWYIFFMLHKVVDSILNLLKKILKVFSTNIILPDYMKFHCALYLDNSFLFHLWEENITMPTLEMWHPLITCKVKGLSFITRFPKSFFFWRRRRKPNHEYICIHSHSPINYKLHLHFLDQCEVKSFEIIKWCSVYLRCK